MYLESGIVFLDHSMVFSAWPLAPGFKTQSALWGRVLSIRPDHLSAVTLSSLLVFNSLYCTPIILLYSLKMWINLTETYKTCAMSLFLPSLHTDSKHYIIPTPHTLNLQNLNLYKRPHMTLLRSASTWSTQLLQTQGLQQGSFILNKNSRSTKDHAYQNVPRAQVTFDFNSSSKGYIKVDKERHLYQVFRQAVDGNSGLPEKQFCPSY